MELEEQYCTRQQAERLKQLGVPNETTEVGCFYSFIGKHSGKEGTGILGEQEDAPYKDYQPIKLYSVAELGELLTPWANSHEGNLMPEYYNDSIVDWWHADKSGLKITCPNEATARAALLIHLLENNLITL